MFQQCSHYGATFIDSPFNACGMHAIITVRVIENNEIYRGMEKTIQRFHCTIVKMEISILHHVILNSQLNRDYFTRCYIIYITSTLSGTGVWCIALYTAFL